MTNKEAAYILSDKCHEYTVEELHTAFDLAIKALENKRPQGEWNCTFHSSFPQYEPDEYRCSICNGRGGKLDKFCKHCGADMRVKDELKEKNNE